MPRNGDYHEMGIQDGKCNPQITNNLMMKPPFNLVSQFASLLIFSGIFFVFAFAVLCVLLRLWVKWRSKSLLPHLKESDRKGRKPVTVGFFHPYCNAGGGGERVLWVAIRALQRTYPHIRCVIYTGDIDSRPEEILARARQRFNIILPASVEFVYLKNRQWVEACKYPYLTLLGQSLGSVYLGWEALMAFVPDIYIDSMGYAFTAPLFRYLGGCSVACYVHYPTISSDMLERVSRRSATYNNAGFIARSFILSSLKLVYYRLFAYLYGVCGKRNDVVMVNSTWTFNHIQALWAASDRTHIVYPPCDVSEFTRIPLHDNDLSPGTTVFVSVAQFRPEKNHALQISSFAKFLSGMSSEERTAYSLYLIGGCRNDGDIERVRVLRELCSDLGVSNHVVFKLNISFEELKHYMEISTIGLHSMWNEHFGIGVVEMMAAGTLVVAHKSGGPLMDIVTPLRGLPTGFLADDEDSYVVAMTAALNMSPDERRQMRARARESVARFSDEQFQESFLGVLEAVIKSFESRTM